MTVKLCFLGLVLAFSAMLLKNLGFRGACVFGALSFVVLLSELPGVFSEILKMLDYNEQLGESAAAIFKIVGIGYLFGISSEICREMGEGGIANAVALAGRFEIIAIATPFIKEIISLSLELVN